MIHILKYNYNYLNIYLENYQIETIICLVIINKISFNIISFIF